MVSLQEAQFGSRVGLEGLCVLARGSVLSHVGTVSVGRTGVRDMRQPPRVLGQGPPGHTARVLQGTGTWVTGAV